MIPSISLKPPSPDPYFVNRQLEIDELVGFLQGNKGVMVIISGEPGIGKSELAWHLVNRLHSQFPDGQMTISFSQDEISTEHAVRRILASVIHVFEPSFRLVNDLTILHQHYLTLLADKNFLLIVDLEIDDFGIRFLEPPASSALVLISRDNNNLQNVFSLNLEQLLVENFEQLLLTLCPRIDKDAPALAEQCLYVPLALRLSATLLEHDDTQLVSSYIEEIAAVDARIRLDYIIQRSFESVDSIYQQLLCQLSILANGVSYTALNAFLANDKVEDWLNDGLDLLQQRNLLLFDAENILYRMPDSIRRFARTQIQSESQQYLSIARYIQHVAADIVYYAKRSSDGLIISLLLFDDYKIDFKLVLLWLQKQDESQTEIVPLIVDLCRLVLLFGCIYFFPINEQRPFLQHAQLAAQLTDDMDMITSINNRLDSLTFQP